MGDTLKFYTEGRGSGYSKNTIYPLETMLSKSIPVKKSNKVCFCIYRINTSAKEDFLEYLLYKYSDTNM